MKFVNRERELERLERWWDTPTSRLAIVWGRRRIGKTALIRRFARDKPSIFHTGAARGSLGELAMLSRAIAASDDMPGTRDLLARPFRDWDDALDTLATLAEDRQVLLVLDELPELATTSPELPNLLRAFLDRSVGRTQLRIILAGSAVRYMNALGEERQPLYGRADLTMQIQPFQPWEAALMLPSLAPSDRALVYGLLGGVPLYLSWWDPNGTVAENVTALAGEPGARMLTEGDFVLATEVEAGEYPAAALYAIANGRTRHNEIKMAIGAEPTRTLDRLVALRLIERVQPVTESGRTRRRSYRVADNFLAFHLGVLGRVRNEIEAGLGPSVVPTIVEAIDDHLGPAWEAAFRAHMRRMANEDAFPHHLVAIGPWWTRDGAVELDAVGLAGRARRPVVVGESKWARRVDGRRLTAAVRQKAWHVPGMIDDPTIVIAARDRVDAVPDMVHVVTASDIFDA